jgi:hypothetical protein
MKYLSITLILVVLCQAYMLFLIEGGIRDTNATINNVRCVAWCADNGMTQVHTKDGCFCVDSDGEWPRPTFWEPDAPFDQRLAERLKYAHCEQGK